MASSIGNHKSPNRHLGEPDPEWTAFCEKYGSIVPILDGTPQEMRATLKAIRAQAPPPADPAEVGLDIRDVPVTMPDGHAVAVRVYRPAGSVGPLPSLLYMHGGGWTIGDLDAEDSTCRTICLKADMMVVSVDYRLAPEHPYPACLSDCWNCLLWVKDNAQDLGIDKAAISVGGSSAGATIATVLAHRARDAGVPLRGQVLIMPVFCHPEAYPPELELFSMEDLKDAPILSGRTMELFYQSYAPPDPTDPEVSPLLGKNFRGLAPIWLSVPGMDPLRDEALAYAEKAKKEGVVTKLDVYPGLPHGFGLFPMLSATSKFVEDMISSVVAINGGVLAS